MEFGLIGEKLGHSYSKLIHSKLGNYDYQLKEVEKSCLPAFLEQKNFLGINITIPYKEEVLPYLTNIDSIAKSIGAVNTIVNKNGKLYGYNTDYYGLKYLILYSKIKVKNKICAILGSGGASKTAQKVLKDMGAKEVLVVSRSGKINYQNIFNYKVQLLINATPIGMFPNSYDEVINIDNFLHLESVIDLIYNPHLTPILLKAKKKGLKYQNGLIMLVAQAKRASELFFDIKIPNYKILEIVKQIKFETLNIVLVGMPGCGKTTLANMLSKSLNKPLFDTDIEFENHFKISPKDDIILNGETAFRNKESVIVKKIAKNSGQIIATGGGSVLSEENKNAILSNSICIFVKRKLINLPTSNRPLSQSESINILYKKRKNHYKKVANSIVKNTNLTKTYNKLIKLINGGKLYEN